MEVVDAEVSETNAKRLYTVALIDHVNDTTRVFDSWYVSYDYSSDKHLRLAIDVDGQRIVQTALGGLESIAKSYEGEFEIKEKPQIPDQAGVLFKGRHKITAMVTEFVTMIDGNIYSGGKIFKTYTREEFLKDFEVIE